MRDAVLDTGAALAAEHGPASVTMTEIAEQAGITRATLYKYYPDVEAILVAWHQRNIARHLAQLARHRASHPGAPRRAHGRSPAGLGGFLATLLADAAMAGDVRDDIPPDELAGYCLHALTAASTLLSEDAVRRLVTPTMAVLRPPD